MRSRRASVLVVVLIVIFLSVLGLATVQQLALENAARTQTLFVLEDSLQRADGILERLISGLKRQLRYNSIQPLDRPDSGDESGRWDGRLYELGWEIFRPTASATRWSMWVWIRFPDDRPQRTYRYALEVRIPALLAPRAVVLTGVAFDGVRPRVPASRREALARLTAQPEAERRAAARAEAYTDLPVAGTPGEAPDAFLARVGAGPAAAAVSAREDALRNVEVLDAQVFAGERLVAARALAAATAPLSRRWVDLARFELAGALAAHADAQPPGRRRAELEEALRLLEAALVSPGTCCAEALVLWRWAHITMRLRRDARDPVLLAATRQDVVTRLQARLVGDGFFHARADVTLLELPPLFEQLWQARVAASVRVGPGRFLLLSVREDGSVPLVHLESDAPVNPLAWAPDGGSLIAATMNDTDPANWRRSGGNFWVGWRISLEGLEPEDVEPVRDGYYPDTGPESRWVAGACELSPDGSSILWHCAMLSNPEDWRHRVQMAWMVSGERRVGMTAKELDESPGWYAHRAVYSPAGERVAYIGRRRGQAGVYVMDTEGALDVRYRFTCSMDDPDQKVGPVPAPLLVPLPFAELSEGETIAGLSWLAYPGAEWFAFTLVQPSGTQVVFHRTQPLAAGATPVAEFSAPLPYDAEVRREYQTMGRIGCLVRQPPGYLVAAGDALYLAPLPGSGAAAVPARWPVDQAGELASICDVCTPPWGGMAFFTARARGAPCAAFVLDLVSGRSRALLGPGGVVAKAREVGRITCSPIPVTRGPPLARVPM